MLPTHAVAPGPAHALPGSTHTRWMSERLSTASPSIASGEMYCVFSELAGVAIQEKLAELGINTTMKGPLDQSGRHPPIGTRQVVHNFGTVDELCTQFTGLANPGTSLT